MTPTTVSPISKYRPTAAEAVLKIFEREARKRRRSALLSTSAIVKLVRKATGIRGFNANSVYVYRRRWRKGTLGIGSGNNFPLAPSES